MATSTATTTKNAPSTSANRPATPVTTRVYDPMIVVEAMFNGCVTRLAQTFQNPKEYAESTKIVLPECTKRFQDALDDCEIQILDAKWYLEAKLAENRTRREVKAKEESAANAANKRKLEESQGQEQEQINGTPSKRPKTGEQLEVNMQTQGGTTPQSTQVKNGRLTPQPQQTGRTTPQPSQPQGKAQTPTNSQTQSTTALNSQPKETVKTSPPSQPKPEVKKPSEPTPASTQQASTAASQSQSQLDSQFNTDDFSKTTPQITPALTNDEFNFESMFGDPNDDNLDGANDMSIDLDDAFGEFTNANNTNINSNSNNVNNNDNSNNTQNQSSLGSILPGLEAYANQLDSGTNSNMLNNNSNSKTNTGGAGADTNNNSFTADLELPDLGGTNIFDDMLNDTDFGNDFNVGDVGDDFTQPDADINFDDLFGDN